MLKSILIAVLLIGVAQAAIRFTPLPRHRLDARPGPFEPGVHPVPGGLKVVRPLAELPEGAFERLLEIAQQTPRTTRIGDSVDPAAFVTRSRLWGFPDIAVIWQDGVNLHLHSHLVYGRSDLGMNAARVARWFQRLETGQG
ncbi:DUF1499 domain-containing protein [Sinisalibacter lacisalsi]|uniref:DUF1499 domain-containing protein n=1 Tax=Sinisalibacter lacisalsi TaxID=1526570 RepID=A0ABQ1QLG2_9RHOB|nr:DUF1499 domain-containing protein [Sinisalibacter lacisalsi]GGD32250.1 hypothetical protein GCM10011358_15430 [Sinisalibacter lacisalsi]